ncbi:Plasma membrane associated protein [Zea mays]|uniref:Plasma membrane associated protein n=1 Tax=Zea mays TaxID=4577 RepID=A0A1D6HXY7_MAIZE|nr:Plasma membrane associated protein [Zea mays]
MAGIGRPSRRSPSGWPARRSTSADTAAGACACWRPSSSSSPSRSSSTCSCSTRASSAAAVATGTTTTASAARPASPRGSPGSEDSDRCSSYMCHHIRRCWSVMT